MQQKKDDDGLFARLAPRIVNAILASSIMYLISQVFK